MDPEGIALRPVKKDDIRDLWLWRNHPETRKWSFCSDEIPFEQHERWFAAYLADAMHTILIAEDERGEKVGQARFEKKGNTASVSVNLNPAFFGKGYGSALISKATKSFLEESKDISTVAAEVIEGNIASLRAFQKAGYLIAKEGTVKGDKKVTLLVYKK